jgi:hypothetical protein
MVSLMSPAFVRGTEIDSATGSPLERALAGEVRDEIGRQYWVRGGTATNQVFCDIPEFPRAACGGKVFGPRDSERFTIEAASPVRPASRMDTWYRVRFSSGKVAYLNADTLRSQMFVEMRHQDTRTDNETAVYELFFNERPEVVIARLQQRTIDRQSDALRREQDRFERGGIRVGMTKQQVLNSSWGQPDRIHTATTGAGLREQWVYGTNNLFFEEGVLTAVQRSR